MLIAVSAEDTAPATHALVIGVSDYPFVDGPQASDLGQSFGMSSLTSAARSASEVVAWLLSEYRSPQAPLASVRVLLSPAAGESLNPDVADRLGGPAPATRAAVERELVAFRTACRRSPDNVAFVYIAGHGVQLTKRGAVVLLQDFGDPNHPNELTGAIDIAGCHAGMDEGVNAQSQIWFSDACRQLPDVLRRFERMEGALTLSEGVGYARVSPLFLASSTRESAFAEIGGTTLFCQALLWALRGAAAVGPDDHCGEWHVGVTQLIAKLPKRVHDAIEVHGEAQHVDVTGRVLELIAQRFETPPDVDIEVNLRPDDLQPLPTAQLLFNAVTPQDVLPAWPLKFRGPAGLYLLNVAVTAQVVYCILDVRPPRFTQTLDVG